MQGKTPLFLSPHAAGNFFRLRTCLLLGHTPHEHEALSCDFDADLDVTMEGGLDCDVRFHSTLIGIRAPML